MKKVMGKIVCLGLALVMLCGFSGCQKEDEGPTVEELLEINAAYMAELESANEQIENLQDSLDRLTGTKDTPAGKIVSIETDGGRTFKSLGGSISLPVEIAYPNSESAPSSSKIYLDSKYSINPGETWTIVLGSTECAMYHASGITVKFTIAKISDRVNAVDMREQMFDAITSAVPCSNAKYGSIFYNDYALGATVCFTTSIDESPAQISIGAFGDGDRSIVWVSEYEGDIDPIKEELLEKLLGTLAYGSQTFKFS